MGSPGAPPGLGVALRDVAWAWCLVGRTFPRAHSGGPC